MWTKVLPLLAVVTVACAGGGRGGGKSSRISLDNQAYNGLVVAISPSVSEAQGSTLIQAIKDAMTEASQSLFISTRYQLWFNDIKILVPRNWSSVTIDATASTESFTDAEIKVDLENPIYHNQPYTVQPGQCGEPGVYTHLTPQYLLDNTASDPYGPRGKMINEEWAKLRWGVFDEMGYPGDQHYPLFYQTSDGYVLKVIPNHCSDLDIVGNYVDKNTGGACSYNNNIPDDNCRFVPDVMQTATSSIMSFTYIDSIDHFCDSANNGPVHEHNDDAPTRQNLMCNHRSVWQVMQDHSDFDYTSPLDPATDTTPTFTVVQEVEAKFTLVLDHSGSMGSGSGSRMDKMTKAAKKWVLYDVGVGSYVSLIHFGSYATLKFPLTQITDQASRENLTNQITTEGMGMTCIGCGLQLALEETDGLYNKVIILITDGAENEYPYISDMMQNVTESGSRVVTIAYGQQSDDDLEQLAQNTGGKTYFVNDNDDGSQLDDAFDGALTYQPGDTIVDANIKIYDYEQDVTTETSLSDSFSIDSTVGRNLQMRVSSKTPSVVMPGFPLLSSPKGQAYSPSAFDANTGLWIINVDMAEEGTWTWYISLDGSTAPGSHFRVTVTAQARDPAVMPIYTESWMSSGSTYVDAATQNVVVYARVRQGDKPVVGAEVRAFVTTPTTIDKPDEMELFDNGQDPDVQSGDGVYCAYFTNYGSTGRYSVTAQVWDSGSTYINNGFVANRKPATTSALDVPTICCGSVVPFDPELATPTGEFTRSAAAGSFNVVNLPPSGDAYPPSRVLDLVANKETSDTIRLIWTAPGEDLDKGRVTCYEIKMSQVQSSLYEDNFDTSTDNTYLMTCAESQNLDNMLIEAGHVVTWAFDVYMNYGQLYYVALKAIDDNGNERTTVMWRRMYRVKNKMGGMLPVTLARIKFRRSLSKNVITQDVTQENIKTPQENPPEYQDNIRWLFPASDRILGMIGQIKNGVWNNGIHYTINSKDSIHQDQFLEMFEHLYSRMEILRLCFRQRGSETWVAEMPKPIIEIKMVPWNDVNEEIQNLMLVPYNLSEGPMWRARIMSCPGFKPSTQDTQQNTQFPHQYNIMLCFHHAMIDGVTSLSISAAILQLLEDFVAGRTLNYKDYGKVIGDSYLVNLEDTVKERLESDPRLQELLEKRAEVRTPILVEAFGVPKVSDPVSYCHSPYIINKEVFSSLQNKFRAHGVTLNSGWMGIFTTALIELVKEEGLVRDTYTVSTKHPVTLRRYLKDPRHIYHGYYSYAISHSMTVPVNMRKNYWKYVLQFDKEFHEKLKRKYPFEERVLDQMLRPKNYNHVTHYSKTFPVTHDFSFSNVYSGKLNLGIGKHIEVKAVLGHSQINNCEFGMLFALAPFRDDVFINYYHSTGRLTHETAQRYSQKVISVLHDISK